MYMTTAKRETMSPLVIPSASFTDKLGDFDKNADHTQAYLNKGVHDYHIPGYVVPNGYRLVANADETQIRLVTVGSEIETAYAVKLIIRDKLIPNETVGTQVMVWRSLSMRHKDVVRDYASMMFDHLLDKYSIMVSDEEQTPDGKRFWEARIIQSIEMGYHVYLLDRTDIEEPLYRVKGFEGNIGARSFATLWHSVGWGGNKEVHRHRLFVISKKVLPETSLTETSIEDMLNM